MAKKYDKDGNYLGTTLELRTDANGNPIDSPKYSNAVLYKDKNGNAVDANGNQLGNKMVYSATPSAPATVNGDALAQQYKAPEMTQEGLLGAYNENMNKYLNNKFSYDFNADPVYQQYRDEYMRQGQLSAKNVSAQAAALTGGYGNSYGTVAAQSVMNQSLAQLNDIVPGLQNAAYSRYQDEQNKTLNLANQYYNMYNDAYNKDLADAQLRAQYMDFSGLNARGIDTSAYEEQLQKENEYNDWYRQYQQQQAQWAAEDRDTQAKATEWNQALQLANLGHYGALERITGLDFSSQAMQDKLETALLYAKNGKFDMLEEMGFPTELLRAQYNANLLAAQGYGTGSGSGGSSTNGGYDYSGDGGGDEGNGDKTIDTQNMTQDEMIQYLLTHQSGLSDSAATVSGYGGQHDSSHYTPTQDDLDKMSSAVERQYGLTRIAPSTKDIAAGYYVYRDTKTGEVYRFKYDNSIHGLVQVE